MVWLCVAVLLSLMLFIWALENKELELTGIEIMGVAGERLQLFIMSPLQQLEGGLYLKKYFI